MQPAEKKNHRSVDNRVEANICCNAVFKTSEGAC